eukprot:745104-Rhodomonas_salina.1
MVSSEICETEMIEEAKQESNKEKKDERGLNQRSSLLWHMQKGKRLKKRKEHDETTGKREAENKLENEAKRKRRDRRFRNPHSNFWEILRPGSEDADESMVDCSS